MEIKTKYNIGDHIWIVQEGSYFDSIENKRKLSGEVEVIDDYIGSIVIVDESIIYLPKTADMVELEEQDIILDKEDNKLIAKIKDIMKDIHEREKK